MISSLASGARISSSFGSRRSMNGPDPRASCACSAANLACTTTADAAKTTMGMIRFMADLAGCALEIELHAKLEQACGENELRRQPRGPERCVDRHDRIGVEDVVDVELRLQPRPLQRKVLR